MNAGRDYRRNELSHVAAAIVSMYCSGGTKDLMRDVVQQVWDGHALGHTQFPVYPPGGIVPPSAPGQSQVFLVPPSMAIQLHYSWSVAL